MAGEPAGAWNEWSGCFSQGGEGGTGVGEKGQEEGTWRTEPAEGAVCAGARSLRAASGSVGSLGPVSLSPADRSISISQDSWASLENNWLPSPPGLGAPGRVGFLGAGWSPVPKRAVCPPLGAVSDGPGGEFLGLFLMGVADPGVD